MDFKNLIVLNESLTSEPYEFTLQKPQPGRYSYVFAEESGIEYRVFIQFDEFKLSTGKGVVKSVKIGQNTSGKAFRPITKPPKNIMRVLSTVIAVMKQFIVTTPGKKTEGFVLVFPKKFGPRASKVAKLAVKRAMKGKLEPIDINYAPDDKGIFTYFLRKGKKADKVFDAVPDGIMSKEVIDAGKKEVSQPANQPKILGAENFKKYTFETIDGLMDLENELLDAGINYSRYGKVLTVDIGPLTNDEKEAIDDLYDDFNASAKASEEMAEDGAIANGTKFQYLGQDAEVTGHKYVSATSNFMYWISYISNATGNKVTAKLQHPELERMIKKSQPATSPAEMADNSSFTYDAVDSRGETGTYTIYIDWDSKQLRINDSNGNYIDSLNVTSKDIEEVSSGMYRKNILADIDSIIYKKSQPATSPAEDWKNIKLDSETAAMDLENELMDAAIDHKREGNVVKVNFAGLTDDEQEAIYELRDDFNEMNKASEEMAKDDQWGYIKSSFKDDPDFTMGQVSTDDQFSLVYEFPQTEEMFDIYITKLTAGAVTLEIYRGDDRIDTLKLRDFNVKSPEEAFNQIRSEIVGFKYPTWATSKDEVEGVSVTIRGDDVNHPEMKKIANVLRTINEQVTITLRNEENLFSTWITDPDYAPPSRGVMNVGITKDEGVKHEIKIKSAANQMMKVLQSSGINFEDLWNEVDVSFSGGPSSGPGGVMEDYFDVGAESDKWSYIESSFKGDPDFEMGQVSNSNEFSMIYEDPETDEMFDIFIKKSVDQAIIEFHRGEREIGNYIADISGKSSEDAFDYIRSEIVGFDYPTDSPGEDDDYWFDDKMDTLTRFSSVKDYEEVVPNEVYDFEYANYPATFTFIKESGTAIAKYKGEHVKAFDLSENTDIEKLYAEMVEVVKEEFEMEYWPKLVRELKNDNTFQNVDDAYSSISFVYKGHYVEFDKERESTMRIIYNGNPIKAFPITLDFKEHAVITVEYIRNMLSGYDLSNPDSKWDEIFRMFDRDNDREFHLDHNDSDEIGVEYRYRDSKTSISFDVAISKDSPTVVSVEQSGKKINSTSVKVDGKSVVEIKADIIHEVDYMIKQWLK